MEEKTLRTYLRLCHNSQFDLAGFAALLARHGRLSAVIAALEDGGDVHGMHAGLRAAVESAISGKSCSSDKVVDQALDWAQHEGHQLIPFESSSYSFLLRQIPRPPPLLYAIGDVSILETASCAIVGSRAASNYGERHARWFAHDLGELGFAIVSGMARGIDSAAHLGALQGGGTTIAVLGTGIDKVYPSGNRVVREEIKNSGLLISEFPLGAPPRSAHFPQRNRIIAGLSLGSLVVESALRSGFLITARLAMEQGRSVFALPGPVDNRNSQGCHKLLREGASLVESPQELCELLLADWHHHHVELEAKSSHSSRVTRRTGSALSIEEQQVIAALTEPAMLVDQLARLAGLPASEFSAAVVQLESRGLIARHGGRVSKASN